MVMPFRIFLYIHGLKISLENRKRERGKSILIGIFLHAVLSLVYNIKKRYLSSVLHKEHNGNPLIIV
jgi:hypothetical protein